MPYKRLRHFSINRWIYKDESSRYKEYNIRDQFLNIYPDVDFYHPKWDCLVGINDKRSKFLVKHMQYDLGTPCKFENKYRLVYSSHFLQLLPHTICKSILSYTFEGLHEKGILRLVVPDADLAYDAYREQRKDFFAIISSKNYHFKDHEYYLEAMIATFISGQNMYFLNQGLKLGAIIRKAFNEMDKETFLNYLLNFKNDVSPANQNWLNYQRLYNYLKKSGFSSIYKSGFGQSRSPVMRDIPLFDGKLPCYSFYLEALK